MTEQESNRTEAVNPIARALNSMLEQKAARPQDVYRLAVIVEGLLDSLDDPDALKTIRAELRQLIHDLSSNMS